MYGKCRDLLLNAYCLTRGGTDSEAEILEFRSKISLGKRLKTHDRKKIMAGASSVAEDSY
jgi:hypothetical protein